jgi:hypothetical protein
MGYTFYSPPTKIHTNFPDFLFYFLLQSVDKDHINTNQDKCIQKVIMCLWTYKITWKDNTIYTMHTHQTLFKCAGKKPYMSENNVIFRQKS